MAGALGRRTRRLALSGLFALAGCTGRIVEPTPLDEGTPANAPPSGSGATGAGGKGTSGGNGGSSAATATGSGGSSVGGTSAGGTSAGTAGSGGSGGSGAQTTCTSSASPGAPVPMRRLTASQVERTVDDVLGVELKLAVSDEKLLMYRSNISTSVDTASAHGYYDFAGAVVAEADLARCETACLSWLLDEVGLRLFRRPLADDERTRYSALYDLAVENDSAKAAAGWVLEAMLQSPSFLYFDDVVATDGTLDGYSTAARLSLLLWGRNPDATLLEHAANGELATPAQVEAEVTRLLADPQSAEGIGEFVDQWLDLARLDDADVRPDIAELGAATVHALRDEPVQFFRRLLAEGAGVGDLLTSSQTIASAELEELYGADLVKQTADGFELDPAHRGGILALPGVASALSHARRTSPTLRGKAVLTGLLCTPPQAPPANVNTTLPEITQGVSTRERLEQHMNSDQCRGCHAPMDGLGFSLEKLDWLGRYREEENGVAVSDESTFPLGDTEVTVAGAAELGTTLAASPDVAACISRQWLRYSLGVNETSDVDCLVEELADTARGTNGLEQMIVKTLTSDWFRRGPGEAP